MARTIKNLPSRAVERAVKVLAGTWKPMILEHLMHGPKRLSELRRLMPKISQKVLVQQLRELEEHAIVRREIFAQIPPRVDYHATALGLTLQPLLKSLCAWGQRHAAEVDELDELEPCTPCA